MFDTRSSVLTLCLLLASSLVFADEAPPLAEATPRVADGVLAYAKDRYVVLRFFDGRELRATPVAYDAGSVTIVKEGSQQVLVVSRAELSEVRVAPGGPVPSPSPSPSSSLPSTRARHVGLQITTGPGNVMLDVDYGKFYGFVSTSIGYPIIFAGSWSSSSSDEMQYLAASLGAGGSWKLGPRTNWKLDLMGTLTPTWWGGFSMGIGVAAGFHYTSPSGFTVGFKVPVFGVAPGCSAVVGESTYAYESNGYQKGCYNKVEKGADLVANHYLQAGMGLPIVSIGYRF